MSAEINVQVRLPGAKDSETVGIRSDSNALDAIGVISQRFGMGSSLEATTLVVAPNARKNGAIINPGMRISQVPHFDPQSDVLEMWRQPGKVNVAIYFREGAAENSRERKSILLDLGTTPLKMIPTLQRALEMGEQEFSLQYAESMDHDGRTANCRWLHGSTPWEDQNVDFRHGVLLCYPVCKLHKVSESSLHATTRGWMWKRSMKGDRISNKQRRLFVLSDAFLYYFKKERDHSAAGVIPLDYYVVTRKIQPRKKKYALLLTLSNDAWPLTTMYKLQAETPEALENWVENIKRRCINAGNQTVFGIDLCEVTARKSNGDAYVPAIVKDCISYVYQHALHSEGIFRLSACTSTVEFYKEQYNLGQSVEFEESHDHNVPAALLKCYLRELPEPLLTFGLYNQFAAVAAAPESERITRLGQVMAELPEANYATSKFLFSFLDEVAKHEEDNKMGPTNLATVFGPNLLTSPDGSSVSAFGIVNQIVLTMIRDQAALFTVAENTNPALKRVPIPPFRQTGYRASWANVDHQTDRSGRGRVTSSLGLGRDARSSVVSPPRGGARGGIGSVAAAALRGRGDKRLTAVPRLQRGGPAPGRGGARGASSPTILDQGKRQTAVAVPASPRGVGDSSKLMGAIPSSGATTHKTLGLEELTALLREEREARIQLQQQVEDLTARVNALEKARK